MKKRKEIAKKLKKRVGEREGKDGEVLESHREATRSLQQIDSVTLKLTAPLDGGISQERKKNGYGFYFLAKLLIWIEHFGGKEKQKYKNNFF